MAIARFPPTLEDIHDCSWQSVVELADKKTCDAYSNLFGEKSQELLQNGNERCANVFVLFANITSMFLRPDDVTQPLASAWHFGETRSANLVDVENHELDLFAQIVADIKDAELQARVADVLWIKRRDHARACLAVQAYLSSARSLESLDGSAIFLNRVQRALAIAVQLGSKNHEVSTVVVYIESLNAKYSIGETKFLHGSLMQLLLRYRLGDPRKYMTLSESAALLAEQDGDWHRAQTYWDLCALWSKRADETSSERYAKLRSAEAVVQQAEDAIRRAPPSYSSAAGILREAIQILRTIGNTKDKVEELHRQLLDYEKRSLSEFGVYRSELEFATIAQQAQEQVKGLPIAGALDCLAMITSPHEIADLRSQVEEIMALAPLVSVFSANIYNAEGKLIGKRPPLRTDDSDQREKAIRFEMIRYSAQLQTSSAVAIVEPARQQILSEHMNVTADTFMPILTDNAFVPAERTRIYANGLLDGLRGDFLSAIHLLIPQMENSFRHILRQRGVVVSGLDAEGIQDEFNLNTILTMPELKEILGDDQIFDLRVLLTEKVGTNLRNHMAHGLLDFETGFAPCCSYAWWIALRLCCIFKKLTQSELL